MQKFLVDSEYLRDCLLAQRPPQGLKERAKAVGMSAETLYRCTWKPPAFVSIKTAAKLRQAFGDRAIAVKTDEPP